MASDNGPYSGANAPDYSQVLWDSGKPYYKLGGGGKLYIPPAAAMSLFDDPQAIAWAKQQGYYIPGGEAAVQAGTAQPVEASQSGGVFHTTGTWNPNTGSFDSSFDWGNLMTMVVAGFLTAGVADAVIGGTASAADLASVANASAQSGTDLATVLPADLAAQAADVAPAAAAGITAPTVAGSATGATGVGLGETGATTGLASGAGLPGAAAAPTVGDLVTQGSAIAGGGAGTAGAATTGASTASTIGKIASLAGQAVGGATQAAGQTQLSNAQLGIQANNSNINANNSNIQGQSAFETELMNRAKEEATQRQGNLADVYRESQAQNPRVSPYDPVGAPTLSPQYQSTLANLSNQGASTLAQAPTYATTNMPALAPYQNFSTTYKPNTDPSTLQQVGNYLSPALSTIGAIAQIYGRS